MTTFKPSFKLKNRSEMDFQKLEKLWNKWLSVEGCFDKKVLQEQQKELSEMIVDMHEMIKDYEELLMDMPLVMALSYWIKEEAASVDSVNECIRKIDLLLSESILSLEKDDDLFDLEDLCKYSHQEVVENIRCQTNLSLLEKEGLVDFYMRFATFLHRMTFGLVSQVGDPDKNRVKNKEIKYGIFIDFVQNLPQRDALIAKLLYFGSPSIDEVLNLKVVQVNVSKLLIDFRDNKVSFPKHLLLDLESYLTKKKENDLVFTNLRGAVVERSHLNQSFSRACLKGSFSEKITPGMLLRMQSV